MRLVWAAGVTEQLGVSRVPVPGQPSFRWAIEPSGKHVVVALERMSNDPRSDDLWYRTAVSFKLTTNDWPSIRWAIDQAMPWCSQ